jgi:hypothetical protein
MIGEGFPKRKLAPQRIREIAIDALRAWCKSHMIKSQMIRSYSVLVRLNNGRHA